MDLIQREQKRSLKVSKQQEAELQIEVSKKRYWWYIIILFPQHAEYVVYEL